MTEVLIKKSTLVNIYDYPMFLVTGIQELDYKQSTLYMPIGKVKFTVPTDKITLEELIAFVDKLGIKKGTIWIDGLLGKHKIHTIN